MAVPIENNTDALQELLRIANSLPEATGNPVLQAKTVSPTTEDKTYTPDPGYDGFSSFTVNAMPTAQQATPSISVSSSGLITASATQTEGYVGAGTKSATQQLTTQGAKTYTPGTSDQTISDGQYLTGAQTIKGDANLVAENIAEGVDIFGIIGTHSAGGGLPDGVSAIDYGTYTPASDLTARVFVQHKLGVAPDFVVVCMDGEINVTDNNGYSVAQWTLIQPYVQGSNTYDGFNLSRYSDGSAFSQLSNQIRTGSKLYVSNTDIGLQASSSAKLKAGATYRWIVGKFA